MFVSDELNTHFLMMSSSDILHSLIKANLDVIRKTADKTNGPETCARDRRRYTNVMFALCFS